VFRICLPERLFETRTGGARCGSLSVLDLHFRIAGRIQNEEGTLVASFSTVTAQPAKNQQENITEFDVCLSVHHLV